MNIKMINKIKSQGHPCRGCPYVFTRGGTDCIMDAVPGDCAWYFYKRLMGHTDATIPCEITDHGRGAYRGRYENSRGTGKQGRGDCAGTAPGGAEI